MKSLIYIILLFPLLAVSVACEEFITIEPDDPLTFVDTPPVETKEDAERILLSAVELLGSDKFIGGNTWIIADMMADQLDGSAFSGDYLAFYTRNTNIFMGTNREMWLEPYLMIYRMNFLLDFMDNLTGISDEEKVRIAAEAKFFRAVGHFEQVRMYAQPWGFSENNDHLGIPLRLEASQAPLRRATVKEVYDQVLLDLQEAAASLPTENGVSATSWAAKAYMARVYFQMNDFASAYTMANDVIENGPFQLEPTIYTRFATGGNGETILGLISLNANEDVSGAKLRNEYQFVRGNGSSNRPTQVIFRSQYLTATENPNDLRGQAWYQIANEGQDNEEYYLTKMDSLLFFDVPFLHLTEVTLIRAEAAAEQNGDLIQAIGDLNAIRTRAGLDELPTSLEATAVIEEARLQRQLEMVGEGNRLHELKRQAVRGDADLRIRNAPWDCPGLVVQLPDEEVAANPDIVKNPEGGCN